MDRIYVNDCCYDDVKVVALSVRSDHKAVVAYTGVATQQLNKTCERRVFRRRSPTQHALFLKYATSLTIELRDDDSSVQTNFDQLYTIMRALIDRFYPEQEITVASSDPHFVTPAVKSMLRRKNTYESRSYCRGGCISMQST